MHVGSCWNILRLASSGSLALTAVVFAGAKELAPEFMLGCAWLVTLGPWLAAVVTPGLVNSTNLSS